VLLHQVLLLLLLDWQLVRPLTSLQLVFPFLLLPMLLLLLLLVVVVVLLLLFLLLLPLLLLLLLARLLLLCLPLLLQALGQQHPWYTTSRAGFGQVA
jgi:hypothetical protein